MLALIELSDDGSVRDKSLFSIRPFREEKRRDWGGLFLRLEGYLLPLESPSLAILG
jgi:hypothetical protein